MLRHIGCHSYLPLSEPWWLIYTPMTQFIAYGSCVLRDLYAVSLIFENFTHLRLASGVAHVSQHQENYAKPTLIRFKPLGLSLIFVFFASWYIDLLYVPPYCKYLVGAIRTRLNWWFTTYTVLGLVFKTYLNLELHHFYLVLVEVSFCNCTHLELHKLFLINRIQWLLQSDWSFNRDQ